MAERVRTSGSTRDNLLEAFWQLYSVQRMCDITIGSITERAGYNRSTFYQYFTDVHDILDQFEQSIIPGFECVPLVVASDKDLIPALEAYFDAFEPYRGPYLVLLGEHGDPAFALKMKRRIKSIIVTRAPSGMGSAELDYTIEFVLSALIGTIEYWSSQGQTYPREKLISLISDILRGDAAQMLH